MPKSNAPKYTDDDAGYRNDPERSSGIPWRCAQLREHALPGAPGQGTGAETGGCQASSSPYLASRGSRTSAKPAEYKSNRLFMCAVIRNKVITEERVTAEEWKNAHKTERIMFPTRDSEWNAVLERAVRNDFVYGALDALRVAGRIDQEHINPRDRRMVPWADQQWNMKKMATEATRISLGMRQDMQAKYYHGRAPVGDWADMPNRDDYVVQGNVSDPNRRA